MLISSLAHTSWEIQQKNIFLEDYYYEERTFLRKLQRSGQG